MRSFIIAVLVSTAFVPTATLAAYRKSSAVLFGAIVGGVMAAYAAQLFSLPNSYDATEGDAVYQLGLINAASVGRWWDDLYYANYPPFQPPLLFWLGGCVKRVFGLSPLDAYRWFPMLVIAVLAGLTLLLSRLTKRSPALVAIASLGVGSWSVAYLVPNPATRGLWRLLLQKPQIVVSSILGVVLLYLLKRAERSWLFGWAAGLVVFYVARSTYPASGRRDNVSG